MNINIARVALLIFVLTLLAGCAAFRTADSELDAASQKLATENVTLTAEGGSVPDAAITPQDDFLVAGKPVPLTRQQRKEVATYRAQYIEIAREGIAIGHEGVEAGRRAVVPMVFAALFGASDHEIQASMDKRLGGVREAAMQLCNRLPDLMATEQRLATDLPAFQPYATLTQKRIDDCSKNVADGFNVADN